MAEARSAVSEPRVGRIEEGRSPKIDFYLGIRNYVIRRFFRTRNQIKNGIWPTNLWNLGVMVLILSVLHIGDWEFARPVNSRLQYLENVLHIAQNWPLLLRSLLVSFVAGFIFFIILLYIRRYMLRILLAYRGWMYEQPKTQGISTKLWGLVVKLVSGRHPTLYACQQSLPKMPVPPLKNTLKQLINSLKPLYGEDSDIIKELKEESKEFQKTLGPKLQSILYLKSWWAQNYVTDFWEKYIYLMGRTPLVINSNYYIMDQSFKCPTDNQLARAANTIYQILGTYKLLMREQIEPLLIRNTIPVCMAQYERCFSTTRVPGEEIDEIVHYNYTESKHICVYRKGIYYKLDVYDVNRKLLKAANIQKLLAYIMLDADKHQDSYSDAEKCLPALTGLERTQWARCRKQHFSEGLNAESLAVVEKALFHLVLGTEVHKDFSSRANYLFHADGKSLWFDKSFTVLVSPDGRMGFNCEHSHADAPVMAHVIEYNLTDDARYGICCFPIDLESCDLENLHVTISRPESYLTLPQRLVWNTSDPALKNSIQMGYKMTCQAIDDIDLNVAGYFKYGKGFVKTCKVSPDAYIQMALQLTYFKNAGKQCLTYESSMTRLYLAGRTETVRSLTSEAVAFVKAFFDKSVSREEKIRLMHKACERHARQYKDCMNGRGIDRHLFALYVVSKGLDYDCEFLKKCLSIPWTLSTSQSPQQQLASSPSCDIQEYRDMVSPGGGFGPVSDDGYGVAYMIPGDFKFFFHVSSKRSTKTTDSTLFMNQLFETFDELKELFEGTKTD